MDFRFRFHIDGAGRVVHDEDRWIVGKRAGEAQALFLAAGKADATLADHGIVAFRHAADEAVRAGYGGHAANVLFVVFALFARTEANVAADGVGKQERVLRDDADLRTQCGERPVSRVDAVNKHAAFSRVVETGDEVDEGGFACARFAENAEFGTCRNMEIHIFKHGGVRFVGEGEADMSEVDASDDAGRVSRYLCCLCCLRRLCCRCCKRCLRLRGVASCIVYTVGIVRIRSCGICVCADSRLFRDVRLRGEQFADFDAGCVETLPVVDQPSGLAHRPVDHPQVGVERHEIAERHAPGDH